MTATLAFSSIAHANDVSVTVIKQIPPALVGNWSGGNDTITLNNDWSFKRVTYGYDILSSCGVNLVIIQTGNFALGIRNGTNVMGLAPKNGILSQKNTCTGVTSKKPYTDSPLNYAIQYNEQNLVLTINRSQKADQKTSPQ